jgi:transposase
VQALLRIGWDTVGWIVERVVADHLDERRLQGLVQIGCDELSYRRGRRYLTNVADHHTGRIVWSSQGRNAQTLQAFFDQLGERKHSIKAVSIDMSGGYEKAVRAALPDARIAFDPFHVVALAGRAVDDMRRAEWNAKGKSGTPEGTWIKNVRFALRKAPENLTDRQRVALAQIQQTNARLYRAYLLKDQLRALYHLDDPARAPAQLDAWLAWASRRSRRDSSHFVPRAWRGQSSAQPLVEMHSDRVAGNLAYRPAESRFHRQLVRSVTQCHE